MADKDARCCSWAFMFLAWAPDSRTAGELVYTRVVNKVTG